MKPLLRIQTPFEEWFDIGVEATCTDGKPVYARRLRAPQDDYPFTNIEDVTWHETVFHAISMINAWIDARQNYYRKLTKRLNLVKSIFTDTGILGGGMLLIEGNQASSRVVEPKKEEYGED